jgi:EmrB/QacA subfamily drug resistance transporter
VLAATVLGSSMAFLDGTVVNVSLPQIQARLGASGAAAQWVVEAYALFLSSLILAGGAIGDRVGRRRLFLAGTAIFAAASAACGLAGGIPALIAARAIQGIGAALLVPNSLAILGAAFPAAQRGRAVGAWSAFTSIATAGGPVVGGWLVESVSWRAVFFINLPFAVAVAAISMRHVPESRDPQARRLDVRGAVLVTLGLAGATYGLIESAERGVRDPAVMGALALGVIGLAAFAFEERRSPAPMVPPALFSRNRVFVAANLVTWFLYAALGATFYFLAFDLIQAQGFSPAAAGAALLPPIAFLSVLSRWAGSLADRFGPRRFLILGPAITGAGLGCLAIPGEGAGYWTGYFPGLAAVGLGMALAVAPLTATVLGSVDRGSAGMASGVNNAVARVASLIAIAALGILFASVFRASLERRLDSASVSAQTRRHLRAESAKLGATAPPPGARESEARAVRAAVRVSVIEAFRRVALACAALAFLASACAVWGIRGDRARGGGGRAAGAT